MKIQATALLILMMATCAVFSGVIMAADVQGAEAENKATTPAVTPEPDMETARSPLEVGTMLLKQKKYDEAVRVLEKADASNPNDFETNILLAEALLAKCEILKLEGNTIYQTLVHRPYRIGQRLYRLNPTHPEPFYLVAKSLLINDSPQKAAKFMKKGIYYAGPGHEAYAKYHVVLGDACMELMGDYAGEGYDEAKKAYQTAMAGKRADPEFTAEIETRLKLLEEKHDEAEDEIYPTAWWPKPKGRTH